MERLVTVAPLRAYTSRLAVEECGDPVLHYKALRRLLREARKLSVEAAKLNSPAAVTCCMMRLIEELRSWHDADKLRAESSHPPSLPLVPHPAKPVPSPTGPPAATGKPTFPPNFNMKAYAFGLKEDDRTLTQKQIAEQCGVEQSTVSRWFKERPEYFADNLERAEKLKRTAHEGEIDIE
jgi:CRP-like cAMP-binding protein